MKNVILTVLTAEEQERLIRLPNLDILELTPSEQKSALLGLAELVFCWAYEQISSLGNLNLLSHKLIVNVTNNYR
jgi:hypothetical protein